jgi:hypothetical protein
MRKTVGSGKACSEFIEEWEVESLQMLCYDILIIAFYSSLIAFYSLLIAFYSSLFTRGIR